MAVVVPLTRIIATQPWVEGRRNVLERYVRYRLTKGVETTYSSSDLSVGDKLGWIDEAHSLDTCARRLIVRVSYGMSSAVSIVILPASIIVVAEYS